MTRLSETPLVHETAKTKNCDLGRFTEIDERCRLNEVVVGDYSYAMQDCEIWAATIGKFVNIASHVRINATNHPSWRATQHHFTYRAGDYFEDAAHEEGFFDWRREHQVTIGHDVWIGHGSIILPNVSIGNGAIVGAGAVVTKDVKAYTVVGGSPAKTIKRRFSREIGERLDRLAWWNWSHDALRNALEDFRKFDVVDFLKKYEATR